MNIHKKVHPDSPVKGKSMNILNKYSLIRQLTGNIMNIHKESAA